jgi:hypothetical protein
MVMAKRARDLTTASDPRFGPWKPVRSARGAAEAIQERIPTPFRYAAPEAPLSPKRGNLSREGADMATKRRGSRWRS